MTHTTTFSAFSNIYLLTFIKMLPNPMEKEVWQHFHTQMLPNHFQLDIFLPNLIFIVFLLSLSLEFLTHFLILYMSLSFFYSSNISLSSHQILQHRFPSFSLPLSAPSPRHPSLPRLIAARWLDDVELLRINTAEQTDSRIFWK